MEKWPKEEPKKNSDFVVVKTTKYSITGEEKFIDVNKVFKPISPRETFKVLAYCIFGLVAITASIILVYNYLIKLIN